jgi:predicted glycosyltransferase
MKILFDIVRPAHVHFFKGAIAALKNSGHEVLVVSREKDITIDLLRELGIPNQAISCKKSGLIGAARELISRNYRLWRIAKQFSPDLFVANNSP